MKNIWIYAVMIIFLFIGGGCSDDVATAHEESSSSESSAIIILTSSSEALPLSYSRPPKTVFYFSNKVEIKSSSSVKKVSSSSRVKSSSSKPKSSSSIASSSAIASSSSIGPRSSADLRFYDCSEYDCVTTEYLNPTVSYGELLDKRDNQVYRTLVISNHVWTAQNMNFETEDDSLAKSWCYDDKPENCKQFGRLYNWEAAQKACPEGWHLPTADEWFELIENHTCEIEEDEENADMYHCAGTSLKALQSWEDAIPNTNEHGFSVIAAGIAVPDEFKYIGKVSDFWTATAPYEKYAGIVTFDRTEDFVTIVLTDKKYGLSVRCIKGRAK